ncbi:MAG: endopeptidase La [Treponema sp.]|jgi:ATP-dependent Lon protease|nr:endopeptidase La [Treponema sp.]
MKHGVPVNPPAKQGAPGGVARIISALSGKTGSEEFPLLPLRELVIFPQTIVPVYITYRSGIDAVECALRGDRRLFAVSFRPQASQAAAPPEPGEIYELGSVVRMVQHLRLPDGSYRVVFHGEYRGRITALEKNGALTGVRIRALGIPREGEEKPGPGRLALMRSVQRAFVQYAEFSKKVSSETLAVSDRTESPERLCNIIGNALAVNAEKKAALLEYEDDEKRLAALLEVLELENEILGIQKNISGKVKSRMEKKHREYILHEQLREINRELGREERGDEVAGLEEAIAAKNPGEEVLQKARKELARLKKLQPLSPEAGVLRGYLEWIADLPWADTGKAPAAEPPPDGPPPRTGADHLAEAEEILEADHYGMEKAKERILEYIAVRELAGGEGLPVKGPILCFAGPPGTGKTSLGKSVARALDRRFVRISLGGVRDEAEIRGHRKTYVGALPGKILQSMRKAGTVNPVFLLDEIDKLSGDFRGDPASALLEVLDPEQNGSFTDHYLELPYDLSRVLFIATANSLHTIPYPLLDRMEVIDIPGYGENEKLAIAKQFLVPKELKENSLGEARIAFRDEAVLSIIRYWTMESGVRGLEREIARCVRRLARKAVESGYGREGKPVGSYKKTVTKDGLEKLLGRRKYKRDLVFKEARTGVVYGLAWTETGGAILPVETKGYEGTGELTITGNLGDVMKESARIALSYLRSEQTAFRFAADIAKTDFHIHVPEGAIPKDGPSAGITLAASLLSTLCGRAPGAGIAMTGELTLTGRILPIGGLKEKILAAIRNGMEKVLLPEGNREDWNELDRDIRSSVGTEFVETAGDVFRFLFDGSIYRPPAGTKGVSGKKAGKPRKERAQPSPSAGSGR